MFPASAVLPLCGAVMALFVALPLLVLGRQRSATTWLGLFVAAIGSLCVAECLEDERAWFGVFDWPVASLGALYYLYVRGLTGLDNGRRQAWHVVPVVAAAVALAWIHLVLSTRVPHDPRRAAVDAVFAVVVLGSQALAVGYLLGALWRIGQYRRRLRDHYSSTAKRDLAWLVWLTGAVVLLLIVWLPAVAMGGAMISVLAVGRLALLFFVGWFGLRQATVFLPPMAVADAVPVPAPDDAKEEPGQGDGDSSVAPVKYSRSGMTEAARKLIGERLAIRMGVERGYLDNDITLAELAQGLGTSPQLLSQYLNDVLGLSFFDYVNGLRVAEVQERMRVDKGATVFALALAAGFNSKSTFNAAFKKVTGLAPSAWRKLHVDAA